MAMAQASELTPAEKAAHRTGACVAVGCSRKCDAFAYVGMMDGYRMCVCGHTQHAHSFIV